MKPIVAAFDFDGTLIDRDSLLPFLFYSNGFFKTIWKLLISSPQLIGFTLGLNSRQVAKESLLTNFFKGMTLDQLNQWSQEYATKQLSNYLRQGALERIKWHQNQGHRCILISASIENYLIPWGQSIGFSDVIASQIEVGPDGHVTGKLRGKNCWGPEKIRRLEQLIGPKEKYTLYAYGDSHGDRELLDMADYAFYRTLC